MTRLPGGWHRDDLEALLYDWHNRHRLRRQRRDVAYWVAATRNRQVVAVFGSGTGRVAGPLSKSVKSVIGLDRSRGRLCRSRNHVPALRLVCGDVRRLPLQAGSVDAVILPYSTVQLLGDTTDRRSMLLEAHRVLRHGGLLGIDVSDSFESRDDHDWMPVVEAPCPELGRSVEEWELARRAELCLRVTKSFRIGGDEILRVDESWTYASVLDLATLLAQSGFDLTRFDRGYGSADTAHRAIYHASRARCPT